MTTIRVWLSATAEPDFETRGERQGIPNIYWQGFEVKYDKPTCQRPFLSLYFDPLDPTVKLPSFPKGTVREVTFTDRYWTGFRNDGLYRHRGAIARLRTEQRVKGVMSDNDVGAVETWQDIQISAGSVKTLREIYAKIRSGYLKPAEDWGTPLEDFVAVGVMLRLMAMTGRI